jgi:hypothetical protein
MNIPGVRNGSMTVKRTGTKAMEPDIAEQLHRESY